MNKEFIIPKPYLPVIAKTLPEALSDNKYKQQYLDKYYDESKRYTLLTGGRGCWKTSYLAFFCAYATMQTIKHNVLFLRYTMKDAKETIANDLLEAIGNLGVKDLFVINKSDGFKIINSNTKNYILIRGVKAASLNQTANVKGLNEFRSVVIDEAEEFKDEALFDKLDNSIRQSGANNLIIALNPAARNHWIYQRWIQYSKKIVNIESAKIEISTDDEVLHVHPSYHDLPSEYLGESWILKQQKLKQKNEKKYNHQILGEWVNVAEGAIFDFNTCKELPAEGASAIGLDYGSVNPSTAVLAVLVENRLYLKQLYYEANTGLNYRCSKIANILRKYPNIPYVGDHDKDTNSELLETYGIYVEAANNDVKLSLDLMEDLEIYIHADSFDLIREYAGYHRKDGKVVKKDDHTVDASRYAFMKIHSTYGNYAHNQQQKQRRKRKAKPVRSNRWSTN